ncbi:MAG: hypothetical protein IKV80_05820 [Bacteroidales bacterium]|jgi:hypothetical protein|nr:hypothetical protein [Bacteroidales bacterium]MBO5848672.1 hypothetical protein [Bacteroidales bacterium]MBR5215723.1 hypothetical protein [Bacteroidales bacterium]
MEDRIKDVLNNYTFSQQDKDTIKEYEKSVKDFEQLINRGITKSRGYNLQTIDDASDSMQKYTIN